MPLIQCEECSNEISNRASNCPSCGHPLKSNKHYLLLLMTISMFAIIVFVGLYGTYTGLSKEKQDRVVNTFKAATNQPVTIYDDEIQVEEGNHWYVPFTLEKTKDITVMYEVISGPNMDVYFTSRANYNNWINRNQEGNFYSHSRLSTFDTFMSNRTENIMEGEYVVVIDNSLHGTTHPPVNGKNDISTIKLKVIKD